MHHPEEPRSVPAPVPAPEPAPERSLVSYIFEKVFSLLPLESSLPMVEVEDSQLFLSSRKALISMASSHLHGDIVKYSNELLARINEADDYLILKQRSTNSLSSILIVLRLMADLCKVHWDSKEPFQRKASIDSNQSSTSSTSVFNLGIGSETVDQHTVPPDKIDPSIAKKTMLLVSRLKSTASLTHELALINGKALSQTTMYEELRTKVLFEEIDTNCAAVLRFIAASNPSDFFDFTVSKLTVFKHNISNDGDYAPYLELFSSVYLDEELLYEYFKHIRVILASVKKASYRQLVLSFFLKALRIWITSRPSQFLNCTRPDSKVAQEADVLFDELSQMPDMTASTTRNQSSIRPLKTSLRFMAVLVALIPSTLTQNVTGGEKKSALKKFTNFTTNRKQKVLSQVIKTLDQQQQSKDASENTSVLESLDFMVTLARIASSICNLEPNNTIVQFTHTHFEMVRRVLVPISSNKPCPLLYNGSAMELELLQSLRMNYYSSICAMKPKEAAPVLIEILNDENTPLDILNITCSIFRTLLETPAFKSTNQTLLMSMYPSLRKVMVRVGGLVKNNSYNPSIDEDDAASFGKTSSSASSIEHQSNHKPVGMIDSFRTSTPSSNNSSTPKTDKFKDTAKSLLKHHHSSNHVTSTHASTHASSNSVDESRFSREDKESAAKLSQLSREVMINAFELFRLTPHAYFSTFQDESTSDKVDRLMVSANEILEPFAIAAKDSNARLVQASKHYIQSFISVANVPDTSDDVVCAYSGSALLIYVLANNINTASASESRRKDVLEHFVKLLEYRIKLYSILEHHSYFKDARLAEVKYIEIRAFVEEALLVCVSAPDVETYPLIKKAFKALVSDFELQDTHLAYNIGLYTAVANDTSLITGQVALQKKIRKIMLNVEKPTMSLINFWQRLYERWYQFAKSDYDELTQTEMSNFRNYAGCIAAVSGIFADIEIPNSDVYTQDIREDINIKIDVFVSQQFRMLGEDNLVTRENAKEILAAESHPKTYPKIIKSLVSIVDDLEKRVENLTTRDFSIIEHVISLLRAVLDNGDEVTVFGISIQILRCVERLASIIDYKGDDEMVRLKLRIRMSTLFARVELNNEKLIIRNAFKIRNRFLRYVYNWFEVAVNAGCDCKDVDHRMLHHNQGSKEWEFIYIDVAIESIKALALLLDGLVLEAPQVLNERELKFSKSSLFSIYFNTFLRALERFSDVDSFPVSVRHKVTTVSDNIVLSLTNLLKSNVDVGLSYALPIGYYTNLAIRVSFLKVFVSIVESYSALDSIHAQSDKKQLVIKIFQLIIHNPDLLSAIARSCPSNDAPALASCALSLASSMNQSAPMVAHLVNEEIHSAMKYSDILRRNSFASRCLSSFGRTIGRDYLVSTLKPILTEIRDSGIGFEVEKLDVNDPDAQQNLENFMYFLRKIVTIIISSRDIIPKEFRYICKSISTAVDNKFANSRLIAVGSFMFLRFLCPAIVSPESERIVDVPNRQTQRNFLLLAKVLQNMANGTVSSLRWPLLKTKEAELSALNDSISDFLDDLSQIGDHVSFEPRQISDVADSDFNFFHAYVYEHWGLVRQEFVSNVQTTNDILFLKKIATEVDQFFLITGQPTMSFGYELPASITPETNPELYDFMTKYSAKDLGILLECPFVHNAFNQEGTHMVVFSYKEYEKVKNVDEELILYRFIQVFSKVWDQKFLFIIDCTGNDGTLLFPRQLMGRLSQIGPEQIRDNCQTVVYYNVSSGLYPILLSTFKTGENFRSIGSDRLSFLSGMEDRKTIMNLGLSKHAVRVYNDVRVKFTDVSIFLPDRGRFEPVMLKIGNDNMQLARTTPQRAMIRGELKEIVLNDVYRLDEIESVAATESTTVPNEMTVKFKDGKEIILASPKFLEIMRLLYFTKRRSLNSPNHERSQRDLNEGAEDMLGQLFNVIFLGLTSSAHEVRSISYNLLAASHNHFKFDIGRDLAQFHEVYFPRDNNSFVISISEKLAVSMPQISLEFIKSFFAVYNDTITPRQRYAAVLYVAPWISNLYEHVFLSDDEHGKDLVADIIRNFLSVSTKDPAFFSAFSLSIFHKICLEDRISEILVDEIVLNAVDREAEGKDWMTSISFLTTTPTIEVCGYVVKRLREITHIPFPNADGQYSLESHGTWTEITVLTHIAVSLFFDSLTLTEMFLPDIFHIITILVDVGPANLRTGIHQLLLNVLQSFLSKKTLSEGSRNIIRTTVEHFTSHRSRLLFGLNRDSNDNFESEITKFTTKISTTESLVASLTEVVEITGEEKKPVWMSRWNRYALDAVCMRDSVLRGRALVLLGILAKGGVSDELVTTVLGYIAEVSSESINDPRYMYLGICTVFALGKISEGLLVESKLFSKMFWLAMVIAQSKYSAVFQGGLKFITGCLESMNIKEKFVDYDCISTLMAGKSLFGDMFAKMEGQNNIYITENNFDQVLLHFAVRGLQLPYAKASSIASLKTFFQVRFTGDMMMASFKGEHLDTRSLCYLFFIFIVSKPSDLRSVLNDIDYDDKYVVMDEQVHIPKILIDFMVENSDVAYLTLYQAAIYFKNGTANDKANLRFLSFMKLLGQKNPQIFIRIYLVIKKPLRQIISTAAAPIDVLAEIFNVAAIASVMPEYSDGNTCTILNSLLSRHRLFGLRDYAVSDTLPGPEDYQYGFMIKPIIERICQ